MEDWSCPVCTFVNGSARTICEMCGTGKPVANDSIAQKPSSTPTASVQAAKWACPQCTFENVALSTVCGMCGYKKEAQSISVPRDPSAQTTNEPSETDIENLMNLGNYSRTHVLRALRESNNSKTDAAAWLLSNPEVRIDDQSNAMDVSTGLKPQVFHLDEKQAEENMMQALAEERERQARKAEADAERKAKVKADMERIRLERQKMQEEERRRKRKEREEAAKKRATREEKEQKELKERIAKRRAFELGLSDIKSAVKAMRERYGMEGVKETLEFVGKLLKKIVSSPETLKYRTLKTSSKLFQNRIGNRVGAIGFMYHLGFRFQTLESDAMELNQDEDSEEVFQLQTPNLALLNQEMMKIDKLVNLSQSKIPVYLKQLDEMKVSPRESILYFVIALQTLVDNIIIAPTSSVATRLDTRSEHYNALYAPVESIGDRILTELGWKKQGPVWQLSKPNLVEYKKCQADLKRERQNRVEECPVISSLHAIEKSNKWEAVSSLVEKFNVVITRILADPHRKRHHTVDLSSIFSKTGLIDGAREFLQALGFHVTIDLSTAHLPYPFVNGTVLLQLRYDLMQEYWRKMMSARGEHAFLGRN